MMDDSENKGTAHYRKTIQYFGYGNHSVLAQQDDIIQNKGLNNTKYFVAKYFFSFTSLGFLEPQCTERGAYACVDGWMLSVSGRYFIFNNNNFQHY